MYYSRMFKAALIGALFAVTASQSALAQSSNALSGAIGGGPIGAGVGGAGVGGGSVGGGVGSGGIGAGAGLGAGASAGAGNVGSGVGFNPLSGTASRTGGGFSRPDRPIDPGLADPGVRPGQPGWGRGNRYGRWQGRGWRGYGAYPGIGLGLGLGYGYGGGLGFSDPYYGYYDGYAPAGYGAEVVEDDDRSNEQAVAYCAKRFKTYDPRSGTYVGKGGRRIACP